MVADILLAFTLVGPTVTRTVHDPLEVNTSTTNYIYTHTKICLKGELYEGNLPLYNSDFLRFIFTLPLSFKLIKFVSSTNHKTGLSVADIFSTLSFSNFSFSMVCWYKILINFCSTSHFYPKQLLYKTKCFCMGWCEYRFSYQSYWVLALKMVVRIGPETRAL